MCTRSGHPAACRNTTHDAAPPAQAPRPPLRSGRCLTAPNLRHRWIGGYARVGGRCRRPGWAARPASPAWRRLRAARRRDHGSRAYVQCRPGARAPTTRAARRPASRSLEHRDWRNTPSASTPVSLWLNHIDTLQTPAPAEPDVVDGGIQDSPLLGRLQVECEQPDAAAVGLEHRRQPAAQVDSTMLPDPGCRGRPQPAVAARCTPALVMW